MTGQVEEKFHEVKRYYEIAQFRGRSIMTFRASCRQPNCPFKKGYLTEDGREAAIKRHRKAEIISHRLRNAQLRYPESKARQRASIIGLADSDTHELREWLDSVDILIRGLTGVPILTLPDFDYEAHYRLGWSARKVARAAVNTQLEA